MLRLGNDMATRAATTNIEARPVGGPTGIPERGSKSADFGSSSGYPPGALKLLARIALPSSGRLVADSFSLIRERGCSGSNPLRYDEWLGLPRSTPACQARYESLAGALCP
jgi:hypothetical protein